MASNLIAMVLTSQTRFFEVNKVLPSFSSVPSPFCSSEHGCLAAPPEYLSPKPLGLRNHLVFMSSRNDTPFATTRLDVGAARNAASNCHLNLTPKVDQICTNRKKLLGTRASLLGARTLLGAPGLTTRSKKLLGTRRHEEFAFICPGTRDATRSKGHRY